MELYAHQKEGIELILKNNGIGALFFDCGLGKTITVLSAYSKLKEDNPGLKLLVICPLILIRNAWIDDINKYFSRFSYKDLHEDIKKVNDVDIYLTNYEMFVNQKKIDSILSILNKKDIICAIDESSRLKTHNTLTTKNILKIKDGFSGRIIMSGTPAPNQETEYWGQMSFLSDKMFPRSFYHFRNTYFHLARGKQVFERGAILSKQAAREIFSQGWKYSLTEEKRKAMLSAMKPYCIWKKKEECLDLPERIEITRKIKMSPTQSSLYKQMKESLIIELNGVIAASPIALTKLLKLRQITSGFVIGEDENSDRADIVIKPNAKLDALSELLDELVDQQVIIWGFFTAEIKAIADMLGDKAAIVNGTVTQAQKDTALADFKAGRIQYLVANPQSVAHGVTLTNCSNQIFYSMSFSSEHFTQAKDRIHRIGQKNACTYFYMACENTIDEHMLDVLNKKKTVSDAAFNILKV